MDQGSATDWLSAVGLITTVFLGVGAAVIGVRADRRAAGSARQAQTSLDDVTATVARLPPAVAVVEQSVSRVDDQVRGLRETLLGFYRDVFGLVSASVEAFLRDSTRDLGRVAAIPRNGGADGVGVTKGHEPSLAEGEMEARILDLLGAAGAPGVSADALVREVGGEDRLYDVLTELYRLRISRQVAWNDPLLRPDTLVWREV